MPDLNDSAYYIERAAKARAAADAAKDPAIAVIHSQMAASYDELAERTAVAKQAMPDVR